MARIRTIKPEFWTSEQNVACSLGARLLFIGLWNFCDDGGVHPASVPRLKMEVFPADPFTPAEMLQMVNELLAQGLIVEYSNQGQAYWYVTGWYHQKIDKKTFKYPHPPDEIGQTVRRPLDYQAATARLRKGNREDEEGRGGDVALELSPGEHEGNALAHGLPANFQITADVRETADREGWPDLEVELGKFRDYHLAHGSKFKDWDAALRIWMRRALAYNKGASSQQAKKILVPVGRLAGRNFYDLDDIDQADAAATIEAWRAAGEPDPASWPTFEQTRWT